ncbi:phosphoserine phosphatase [[Candida] railenensis]|uniref:phosphoserine phosphatase n=1 Tax=[Candida] railenensis TaxID=45579 RepID=A0A9P0W1W1_9ASCO|nr:phosphoserine phosphatase [[Candida] railenensis]
MSSYVFTVISHGSMLSEQNIGKVEQIITDLNCTTVSKKTLTNDSNRVIDYYVDINSQEPTTVSASLKSEIIAPGHGFDVIFQKVESRSSKKLFVFDMDSTLIYQEVIELIAAYAGIEDRVAEITERAMNGELDFTESLKERVKLLKGIDSTTIWEELKFKIEITNGALELCKALKSLDCVMAVCSGGFIPLAEHVKTVLGLNYAYANQLSTTAEGILDGTTKGMIVNGDKKAELLLEIAAKHNIDPQTAVAVGDGANDLNMMAAGGFGVAWNAKPKVQQLAPCCLNTKSLQDILYIMGYNDDEQSKLIK